MNGQDAVEATGLSKAWKKAAGRSRVLDEITLRIPRGVAFGLSGPNGAGKTTFLKVLTGAVRPSAGMARVFGHAAGSCAAAAKLGYVSESTAAPEHLTAWQLLDYHGALYGLESGERRRRAAALLAQVGLAARAGERLGRLSRGMRQRAAIAAAMVHHPELLILDEPTDGLDPVGRRQILDLLRYLNRDLGVSLIVSSHLLNEVEGLCQEVAVLHHGRLVRHGSLRSLTAGAGYTLTLRDVPPLLAAALATRGAARPSEEGELRINLSSRETLDWTLEQARVFGARVEALSNRVNSLEDLYLEETREKLPC